MSATVASGAQPQPLPGGMGGTGEPPRSPSPDAAGYGPRRLRSKVAGLPSPRQADALRKVQVQKLRSDGLKIQADAQAAFGRGETDLAIQMLVDYANRVRSSGLEPSSVAHAAAARSRAGWKCSA